MAIAAELSTSPLSREDQDLIESGQFIKLCVCDAQQRKSIYTWCQAQGYFHVGYIDENRHNEENGYVFYCDECRDWKSGEQTFTEYCCTDSDGNQRCSDWTVRCRKHPDEVIWSADGVADGYKHKLYKRNNMIAIHKNDITSLEFAFKTLNIPIAKAERWMRKREKQHSSDKITRKKITTCKRSTL